jgi:hypothetical protein
MSIIAILPTDAELTSNFVDQMKCLSSQCQTSFGSLHPHGKKQFFAAMIEDLDMECKKKIPPTALFHVVSRKRRRQSHDNTCLDWGFCKQDNRNYPP